MLNYVINQDYIAEFLCINKENTALNCKGKCYLMQQLQKQTDEKKQNLPKIAMEEYPIGFVKFITIAVPLEITQQTTNTENYKNNYSYLHSYSNFHPPSVIL